MNINHSIPEVSVIISTCNRAHLVGRAIKSVLMQTFRNFELIVVDDASEDNTGEVVKSFQDERIKYVRHGSNEGAPHARNEGIKLAQGEYIAFLDDDDEWMTEKLEKQLNKIKTSPSKVGVIYSGIEVIEDGESDIGIKKCPEYKGDLRNQLLKRSTVGSVSKVLVKRECFDKAGMFDENLRSCQDWDMWLRISKYYEFDFAPEILVKIHMHGVQISRDLDALIAGRARMVEKHMSEFSQYPELIVVHLKRIGKLCCMKGDWIGAVSWFKRAIKINKLEIIKIIAWCIFELPLLALNRRRAFKDVRRVS
ncbi:MAG: glycosyltransferase [Candidatus Omnitrophica bacterium]|nr:glycosyltransferase [Candidatus Omnitrophota bacterium]